MFEKARRRRGLWLVLLIVLALLMALVALHMATDATANDGPLICIGIMLIVAAAVLQPRAPEAVTFAPTPGRGPPQLALGRSLPVHAAAVKTFAPLRL